MRSNVITFCFLPDEKEFQENRNLKTELDLKTEGLKNDLQDYKEETLNELKNITTTIITDFNVKNEEAKRVLNEIKETAANLSRQG